MTFETRIIAFAQAIGTDIKALNLSQGNLSGLSTTTKTSLVAAINELFTALASAGVKIDDAAGDGALSVTWSANKIFDMIAAAKVEVTNSLTGGAAAALDTLNELAAALGNDPAFATTIATQISNRVRFDAPQTLTAPQQAQALSNIGAVALSAIGNTDHDFTADYTLAKA
jgi:hypothetical protein